MYFNIFLSIAGPPRRSSRVRKRTWYDESTGNEDNVPAVLEEEPKSKYRKRVDGLEASGFLDTFRQSESLRHYIYRSSLTDEQRKESNKLVAARMRQMRKRKKYAPRSA
jgi:hypothetical protein